MGTKHIHAEVIKAWADGDEVELFLSSAGGWETVQDPSWSISLHYRVKPKNIVVYREARYDIFTKCVYDFGDPLKPNIKYEFTPEGKLVSVEMIK